MNNRTNPLTKIIKNSLHDLPTPINISFLWNFGSLLGICLMIQICTGLFLTFHYCADSTLAFNSINKIYRDINNGWMIRTIHANGASLFFLFIYLHIGRGLYYHSFKYIETWNIGVMLLLLTMGTAFMGYILPWGQMSFWGASVITNLLSAIPYLGTTLVQWVWGGFSINSATLTRFYSLHFLLPFVMTALTMIHLLFLHQTGSNNPLGMNSESKKITFNPYFYTKDLMGILMLLIIILMLIIYAPYTLMDPDNFTPANPMVTPVHIQPEWYFLFAYTILRSIPNKLGGVIALLMSIIILFFLPFNTFNKFQSNQFYPINKILYWILVTTMMLLTWIGMCPVEYPYIYIGQLLTIIYFTYFTISPIIYNMWDKNIN